MKKNCLLFLLFIMISPFIQAQDLSQFKKEWIIQDRGYLALPYFIS